MCGRCSGYVDRVGDEARKSSSNPGLDLTTAPKIDNDRAERTEPECCFGRTRRRTALHPLIASRRLSSFAPAAE
jgi:hypothetical protein